MNEHVMLDIETLGTGPNAMIIAIGAATFNAIDIIQQDYFLPEWKGGDMDANTVRWWMNQSAEARDALYTNLDTCLSQREALQILVELIGNRPVWGNGSDFDNVIVINACKREGVKHWSYRNNRCYRTIKNMYDHGGECWVKPKIPHHAMYDAMAQAESLIKMSEKYGIPL